MTSQFWEPGTRIQWIYERTGFHSGMPPVRPMTVVRDDADGLVAWLAPGTPLIKPVLADGADLRIAGVQGMFVDDRALKLGVWRGTGILKVAPAGKPWSVWHFWGEDGDFLGWYVNLEAVHRRDHPARRTFTEDFVLDLWMTPDRAVERKDEDELEGAVDAGRFTAADAERIVADAVAAEKEIAAWGSPFSDRWQDWRPDLSWRLPEAPTGYDVEYVADELMA